MGYPKWVLDQKAKGTNISCINGKYYLYAVSSVWNKEKGRAQKITNKYLGRITEEGLIPPKVKIQRPISVKEYGACSVIMEMGTDILERLKMTFTEYADVIFTIALIRVIEHCPFKRIEHFYEHSYLSETFKDLKLSSKDISLLLKEFGVNRERIVEFMEYFIKGNKYILFDGTNIISKSKKMNINQVGYNAHRQYDPQINLLYAFACDTKLPVYYRIIPGNIRDVSAFKLSVTESKLQNMIIVADKGFGSQANFDMLEENGLSYIIPLRRNNSLFNTYTIERGNKADFDGYFIFNERPIWYYKTKGIMVYLDNDLKNEEEKDYLNRIEKNLEGYTYDKFLEKQYKFGSIVMKTNINKPAQEIYAIYKERGEIEQSFDFLKNLLEQDKSYMQNERSLETWAFINHISLMLNYKIYNLLRENKLLSKYSVADFLVHLKYIFRIRVSNQWHTTEISKKTHKLLESIHLHIT